MAVLTRPWLVMLPYWMKDRVIQKYGSIEVFLDEWVPYPFGGWVGFEFVTHWEDPEPERYFFPGIDPSIMEDQ